MTSLSRDRILIVDDEEAILETLEFSFEDDYEVFTAPSGKRALEILQAESPIAAVISDQRMPVMTGVEFLKQVSERCPETVRILLTGFADMGAIVRAVNEGHIYSYVPKPWEPNELRQVVRHAVELHHLNAHNAALAADADMDRRLLEAVSAHIPGGCLILDADGNVKVATEAARKYLEFSSDPCGQSIDALLEQAAPSPLAEGVQELIQSVVAGAESGAREVDSAGVSYRLTAERMTGSEAGILGTLIRID